VDLCHDISVSIDSFLGETKAWIHVSMDNGTMGVLEEVEDDSCVSMVVISSKIYENQ
jgi:hypothetical protein